MDQQGPGAQPRPQTLEFSVLAMEYVLAMLLPQGMPWSEVEDGMPFFTWFEHIFSERDSKELIFIADSLIGRHKVSRVPYCENQKG